MTTVKWVIFLGLSAGAVMLSANAFRNQQTYGYFRLIAFESMILLFIRNISGWFQDMYSSVQLISWLLLTGSSILAVHGAYLLRAVGKARKRIVEDTAVLVEIGVYRYIRHPLYTALMLLAWGIFFKGINGINLALVVISTSCLVLTGIYEEQINRAQFGRDYDDYMKRTRRFIPFVL